MLLDVESLSNFKYEKGDSFCVMAIDDVMVIPATFKSSNIWNISTSCINDNFIITDITEYVIRLAILYSIPVRWFFVFDILD